MEVWFDLKGIRNCVPRDGLIGKGERELLGFLTIGFEKERDFFVKSFCKDKKNFKYGKEENLDDNQEFKEMEVFWWQSKGLQRGKQRLT